MSNWKTTVAGICTILGAVAAAGLAAANGHFDASIIASLISAITAGVGLFHAKDAEPK